MAALNIWTKPSGYDFVYSYLDQYGHTVTTTIFPESKDHFINLPVNPSITGVTYKVISGQLPPGLRLEGNQILGSPYEVPRITKFTFCIRAQKNTDFADRTFNITVEGEDAPTFVTQAGLLNIGSAGQLFVQDSTFVDYQLEAVDFDMATGQHLSFFISKDDGQLPPGVILTDDGRIVGFVQPTLSIKPNDGDGTYDDSYYDAVAYDFAFRPTNGYDSYIYDSVFYGFALDSGRPAKLNRTYEFNVTVTDGDSYVKRKFSIFVIGDDYYRADNTSYSNSLITADVTYMRAPIWITPSYLGKFRANNYLTLTLDTYDTENVIFTLEDVNANVRATTKKLTTTDNTNGNTHLTISLTSAVPQVGYKFSFASLINNAPTTYTVMAVQALTGGDYRLTLNTPLDSTIPNGLEFILGTPSVIPSGMQFDQATSELFGSIPYQPAVTTSYTFTVTASRISDKGERANNPRMFTVDLLGEIDSVIEWVSPSNLGTINANFISTLSVKASSVIGSSTVLYRLLSGALPPGLSLDLDGEIVGKVNQYGNPNTNTPGLTTFDYNTNVTTFDGGATTIDRVYTFTVEARDQFGFTAVTKTFSITIETPNELIFSNIRVKPFLKLDQRAMWSDFINNTTVFTPSSIYRPNDPSFGVQTDLSMLVYAGVETKEAAVYVGAMGLNHKRKRFQFGDIKKATGVVTGTTEQLYEVVYIQMVDPLEPNGKRLPNKLEKLGKQPNTITVDKSNLYWSTSYADLNANAPYSERPEPIITVDSSGYEVSNPNVNEYFPNSISNWRDRINNIGFKERNYLPLWMRSIQPGTRKELDFQLAVPLCYCKVGTADDIILNIKNYIKTTEFSFNLLDYTADRYIIDSVEGQTQDKYLVFRNDRITV